MNKRAHIQLEVSNCRQESSRSHPWCAKAMTALSIFRKAEGGCGAARTKNVETSVICEML